MLKNELFYKKFMHFNVDFQLKYIDIYTNIFYNVVSYLEGGLIMYRKIMSFLKSGKKVNTGNL